MIAPNRNIFCNAPWYELHIYWDGSLGFCCHESHLIFPTNQAQRYNVKNMSIREWMDSEPMRRARTLMFGDSPISFCDRCYHEESHSGTSRRHRANLKSVIFTRSNFDESYLQNPGLSKFESSREQHGHYDGLPIDLHIDLGNYCNLACKMCHPQASSRIASQHVTWGLESARQYLGTDWTRDQSTWERILAELAAIPNLKNVHFMGGETLITRRFEDFVDYMLSKGRTDLNLSFVTNGTVFNQSLMSKLREFQRIGIEISIESLTDHNQYQRQGTDNAVIKQNIQQYLDFSDGDRITITARPTISLLTVGTYHTLLAFCLENKIVVKSLLCTNPAYLDVRMLPKSIKDLYITRYHDLQNRYHLDAHSHAADYNESDPNEISAIIQNQLDLVINLLNTPTPDDSEQQLSLMVSWCRRWDQVFGFDARKLYPEFCEILNANGYKA